MMNADDLHKIRELIYKETGMRFDERKDYFLTSRLQNILATKKYASIQDLMHHLLFGNDREGIQRLIEAITINETYFFRDYPQLQGFAENVLGHYLNQRQPRSFDLKVWCAACSTGEEAYTLAIILREMLDDFERYKIELHASDIDRIVLQSAEAGRYGERSMKETPVIYRDKYFERCAEVWQVKPILKRMINFKQLNLSNRSEMRAMKNMDFIFCRNVLIYFDEESRKKVVSAMFDALTPGGYLFLGHSESVGRITASFQLDKIGNFLCYKKPGA